MVDTYADRLLDLTDGSTISFDRHLNYIAHEFISTVDYSRTVELASHLVDLLYDYRKVIKWVGEGTAFGLAKTLVENVFNIKFPF